ncbi:hypothetical protein SUGI_0633380 [Cryptomeria japonica]|uniref:cytochrome P450 94A1 n=1 Tax=Cryptomeria japonica TaxID=3369 RepID=UPI002414CB50|nr:cytochrome P450 94A1 [Cryptomeria japonica]GLJ31566.1 hypothetical protein SUGI_0633380 [Cryptomeria japonica]
MKSVSPLFLGVLSVLSLPALALIAAYIIYRLISERDDSTVPTSYPIVGSLFAFLKNRSRLSEWLTELLKHAPSNTITFHRPGIKVVITADPGNVEHLLKTRFENYPKGNYFRLLLHDLLGTGIFNADGEAWKLQRKVASYEFSTNSLRDFIAESVQDEVTHRLLPLLRKAAATNHQGESRLDMQDVFKRFAFDNICKVAFGMDPGCLDISLSLSEFAEAFEVATNLSLKRFTDPLPFMWMVKRMFNFGSEKRLRQAIHTIHSFAQEVIDARKKEIFHSHGSRRQDLLSRFLFTHESAAAGKASYDVSVRDIVISFILAGRDTTSSALTWFFWLLSSHPRVEKNIYAEITRIIAAREESSLCFPYEELKKMQYLQAALCESMRLYPPVPSDTKQALEDDVLPDGTVVRKGMRVIYHPYAMGRMESVWGSDCLEFKPERWLSKTENGSVVFVAHNAFKYPVFQAGPRVCLGKEMAFIQMKSIAASIIEEFSVKVDHEWNPKYVAMITAKMENGLPVRVVRRMEKDP